MTARSLTPEPRAQQAGARTASPIQRQCACGASAVSGGECAQCAQKKKRVQTRLRVGAGQDSFEREADRVADEVIAVPPMGHPPGPAALGIQRLAAGEAAAPAAPAFDAPGSIDRALQGAGTPMERPLRQDMERRFGHDFSRVRVHTDAAAAQSAQDIQALAYTSGQDIVFGAGRYAPGTEGGRRLLAHELTHVVQQDAGAGTTVRRKVDVGNFESDTFSDEVLDSFLTNFTAENIENHSDSDEKARTILRQVLDGKRPVPAADKLIMMIVEMQAGWTGSDDEHAILTILYKCETGDAGWPGLGEIFAAKGGIDPEDLDDDFQGEEEDALRAFYERVFVGGREAALDGSRKLKSKAQASKEPEKAATASDYTPPESDEESADWAQQADELKLNLNMTKDDAKASADLRQKAIDLARGLASALSESAKLPKPNQARLENLRQGLKALFEALSNVKDWDSIADVASTVSDARVHESAITSLSNDAAGSAGQQRFLVRVARIYGETLTKPAPKDPKGWMQANTEAIGRVFMAIDRENLSNKEALQFMAPSLTRSQKLLDQYTQHIDDAPYDPRGRLTSAMRTDPQNQSILLDCDGYAAYGARLLRAQNWETFGYMVINPHEPKPGNSSENRDSHAVVMARKPSKEQGRWLWVGVSNATIKELGGTNAALTEDEAWRQLLLLALEVYGTLQKYKAFHLPAVEGGAIDPRLLDAENQKLSAYVDST